VVTCSPVLPINSQTFPGHNQETYQRLQQALQATPPPQLWVAVCDDLPLQRQLAATLEESLQTRGMAASTQRWFDADRADLVQQFREWLHQLGRDRPPLLQILGIEQLTQRSSDQQYWFLTSLEMLIPAWRQSGLSLLIWLPRPWLKQIRREFPAICQTVFEFMGEPTPLSAIAPETPPSIAFSPVRQWQFLGRPAPEAPTSPPPPQTGESLRVAPESTAVPALPNEPESVDEVPTEPPAVPTFSDDLWQRLQSDLSQFEQPEEMLPPPPKSPLPSPPQAAPLKAPAPPPEATPAEDTLAHFLTADPPPAHGDHAHPPLTPEAPLVADTDPHLDAWAEAYEWRDRVQDGDHSAPTLATAIHQYERLQAEAQTTPRRTEVLNDLGSLYWLWAQQASDWDAYYQRLARSCDLYEASLAPVTPGTEAPLLTRIHSNLGSVYSLLAAHQDPTHYLGKAVRAFHRALQYVPADSASVEYATLQTHLGTAYWSLAQHTHESAHLHRAIAAYQEALRHAQPQQSAPAYAQLQNNLGIALWSLSRHERPAFLLEQAIAAYKNALAYRTLATDPAGCAATHNNLGTAYWDLGGHHPERSPEQLRSWQQAIKAYETALIAAEQTPSGTLGFDLWATHHSVGVVYDQLAIALVPNTQGQQPLLTRAFSHYVQAYGGWQATQGALTDTAFQALIRNLQLQERYLGVEAQQRSLEHLPAEWLPDIWRRL